MELTGIIIENAETKMFTAFIEQFPGVIAQGESLDEVQAKLNKAWGIYVDFIKKVKPHIEYSEPEQYTV